MARAEVEDRVEPVEGLWSVADHDDAAAVRGREYVVEDGGCGGVVEVRRGLVEQHQRAVGEHGTRDAEPGPLAAGHPTTAAAQPGLETVGQAGEPGAEAGALERPPDRGVVGVRAGQAQVRAHGGGEHVRLVVDDGHVAAHVVDGEVANVGVVDRVTAPARVEVAGEHRQHGALPRPVRADDRDPSPGREVQVGGGELLALPGPRRRDPVEVDPAARGVDAVGHRGRRVGHRRLLVEERLEAHRTALGPGEVAHRVDQRGQGVTDGDRYDDQECRDRAAGVGGVDQQGGEQGGHGGGHEEGRGHQGTTAALPPHHAAQRVVGVGEPPGGRVRGADRLEVGRLARHEVADPEHLGPGLEQLVARARLEHPREPAGHGGRDEQAGQHEPDRGGEPRGEQDGDEARQGARDQWHRHPHLRLDHIGEVVHDPGEHARP